MQTETRPRFSDSVEEITKGRGSAVAIFKIGDFYEAFNEDAEKLAPILELTLTHRNKNPMVGFPHHSFHRTIAKLVSSGIECVVARPVGDGNYRVEEVYGSCLSHTVASAFEQVQEDIITIGAGHGLDQDVVDQLCGAVVKIKEQL